MSRNISEIVSLAVEITECSVKALDTSRERVWSGQWSSGYTMKAWAADVLRKLPDDREKALLIVKAHMPGGVDPGDRRKVGQLCGRYYRKLSSTDLVRHGQRFLKIMS